MWQMFMVQTLHESADMTGAAAKSAESRAAMSDVHGECNLHEPSADMIAVASAARSENAMQMFMSANTHEPSAD
jgi:hypothetical protein